MKKIIIFFSALLVISCKKAELMRFQAHNNIYFKPTPSYNYVRTADDKGVLSIRSFDAAKVDTAAMDTLYTNFGFYSDNLPELSIMMEVQVMGDTSAQNRPIKLSVVNSTVPASLFTIKPEDCVLPHGTMNTLIPLTIRRADTLRSGFQYITVQLEAGNDLATDYRQVKVKSNPDRFKTTVQRTFAITDNLPVPSWWLGSGSIGAYCLGNYSVTKMKMLINDMNIPLATLLNDRPDIGYLFALAQLYNCHLAEARKAGHPIQDMNDKTGQKFDMEPSVGGGNLCD
ncbi:DUF4843 domain-containing protein [Chitinophaga vietnamensis]|uniref:DUF4843 domain-containing protein n=1 Tax=Chitinophaga vietnamensis TaxID=2593957 RepID=UPI0011778F4F|nr:DUF4843 domain-containing protein [Chitinophaga vietnamensis]